MIFKDFKIAIQQQFGLMSKYDNLFVTDIDKDTLWETYLDSFPAGTNEVYKERREYDCQNCKRFIRACGNVVAIIDNDLISIWDIRIGGGFQEVADAMSKLVKSKPIADKFMHYESKLGTDFNHQLLESGETLKWEHFYFELPGTFLMKKDDIPTFLSGKRSGKDVFKRGLEEITVEATETVLELIEQKSIYRGEENKNAVEAFLQWKKLYLEIEDLKKDNFCWAISLSSDAIARVRNTAIGTLLVDISNGIGLDDAVRMFESKVAPTNYKRPKAVVTKSMIANAQKKVEELGIESSLYRRYAVTEDITIQNVLFADRTAKKAMNVFEELSAEAPTNLKNLEKVEEVDIEDFIGLILPKADTLELLFENRLQGNLVSLIAPTVMSKNILKWGNNYSWAYKGEVADSMKERVKKAGGNVTGVLRFSIQWNDGDDNQNDFDAHCLEPDGNLIYFPNKRIVHTVVRYVGCGYNRSS